MSVQILVNKRLKFAVLTHNQQNHINNLLTEPQCESLSNKYNAQNTANQKQVQVKVKLLHLHVYYRLRDKVQSEY